MPIFVGLVLALILSGPGAAQVETYAAMPRIWSADISPDGSHLATGCSPRGLREICIYDLESGAAPIVIPAPEGGRMTGFSWPSDSYLVYYVTSVQTLPTREGLRTWTLNQPIAYSVATGRSEMLMVGSNMVSPLIGDDDRIAVQITYALDTRARTGSRIESRDDFGTVVYEMNLQNGRRVRRLHVSTDSAFDYVMNQAGEAVLEARFVDETGQYTINRSGRGSHEAIYSGIFNGEIPAIYGLADGGRATAVRIPGLGLRRLDIASGEVSRFDVGDVDVSLMDPIVDDYAMDVVGFTYVDDLRRQIFTNPELAAVHAELRQILTEDSITITAWNRDWTKLVVVGEDSGQPANIYLLDLTSGGLGLLDVETVLPEGQAPSPRNRFDYTASDGLAIEAYVTLPPGQTQADGPFPLIVMPHGGPQARDTAGYGWWSSFYASLGYAVLQPNFRGSDGYGYDFLEAGYGGFGTRMIDDIIDGAHALQQSGLARPGAYCASGWSYGGYAALMVALRDPENVACAISFAGVTDPFAILESRNSLEISVRYWEQFMGDRYGNRAQQGTITPAERAADFRAPLLIMHGELDTTVPYGQFRLMYNAMEGRSNARFVTLPGEDHYLSNPQARATVLRESQAFLDENFPAN
ncbi:alpha/beta fold hydrolase [uncultured Maricaulis sp.]|mgnify:CR=1 FL=1|uniref:alpha/beta hydrolase family protein n=1 Tax=uncultured Maricaulis sp. TaxID=174710 RepID=UPI0030DD6F9B